MVNCDPTGPEVGGAAVEDATRELQDHLVKAREARTLVDRLNEEISGHEEDIATAEEVFRQAQHELQALAKLAQCEIVGLPKRGPGTSSG